MTDHEDARLISAIEMRTEDHEKAVPARPAHQSAPALRWLANLSYAGVLVVMAVLPSSSLVTAVSFPDWFAHAIAYGVQAGLLYWALLPSFQTGRALVTGAVGAMVFGSLTEGLQVLQPSRSVELLDLTANFAGILAMSVAIVGASRLFGRNGF